MSAPSDSDRQLQQFHDDLEALRRELARRVIGQEDAIQAVLTALVVGGHVLLEGLPGTGKTLLARTLADAVDLSFHRIQCTADLMPADIIGTYVVMETPQGRRTFEFHRGPLFANLVLADHVNRAPPRTQSALLQAMDEESIAVGTESFPLPRPHVILATQNPAESDGAYPLPDAQVDRFLLKAVLPPPGAAEIEAILERAADGVQVPVQKVVDAERVLAMRELVRRVPMPAEVRRLAVSLAAATQPQSGQSPPLVRQFVRYGSGPRGALALVSAAKARALMAGRTEAIRDDVSAVVLPALRHRLTLNCEAVAEDVSPDAILTQLLQQITPR